MSWPSRRKLGASLALLAMWPAVAASGNGSTYAAFSDFIRNPGNAVGAASVAVVVPGGSGPSLSYVGLLPGTPTTQVLPIRYTGDIPGDLALELRPRKDSAYCDHGPDGRWESKAGGAVQISVGSGWLDYCSLLNPGGTAPVAAAVSPGSLLDIHVSVQLSPGTDFRFSGLTDHGLLTVAARQAGGGAFHDWTVGTIVISTGSIAPPVPASCGDLRDYDIVTGTEGDDVIRAGNGKQVVLGFGGDDVLDGGNAKDCLVGGEGDDLLHGANGKDVMVGGNGIDTCHGGLAPDLHECEAPLVKMGTDPGTPAAAQTETFPGPATAGGVGGPVADQVPAAGGADLADADPAPAADEPVPAPAATP